MKLELKHLAPYLPYGLKILAPKTLDEKGCYFKPSIHELNLSNIKDVLDFQASKPILRPLSDLTKDNARFLSSDGYMDVCEECIYVDEMHYSDVLKLIERHYDVFGLIEKGLAISYNELK